MFKITKKDKNSKARLGILSTAHGRVLTPSYVMVGTYGQIRHLTSADIKKTKTQIIIANTFHLWDKAIKLQGSSLLYKDDPCNSLLCHGFGKIPTMTDSGGFQVLSLAFNNKDKAGKFMTGSPKKGTFLKRDKIRITSKGVYFTFDGKKMFLGPELSIKLQQKIGADIIFAFDHITSPLDNYAYNKKAVELTDKWAETCLKTKAKSLRPEQQLFGIVQGGLFKDLRMKSAKSIGAMALDPILNKDMRRWPQKNKSLLSVGFDGFGIGGSYTKKQIAKVLKWVIPYLPEEKPRHLLGVGKIEDIFEAVENGMDLFDCVIPTREARHGRLYAKTGHYDIGKLKYSKDKKIIEPGCKCPTCSKKVPRSKIRELLKSGQPVRQVQGQRYALMHNMWFFNNLLQQIRDSISKGKFKEFKKRFLNIYTG